MLTILESCEAQAKDFAWVSLTSVFGGYQLPSVTSDRAAQQEECPETGQGFMALHRLDWAVNCLRKCEKDSLQLQ